MPAAGPSAGSHRQGESGRQGEFGVLVESPVDRPRRASVFKQKHPGGKGLRGEGGALQFQRKNRLVQFAGAGGHRRAAGESRADAGFAGNFRAVRDLHHPRGNHSSGKGLKHRAVRQVHIRAVFAHAHRPAANFHFQHFIKAPAAGQRAHSGNLHNPAMRQTQIILHRSQGKHFGSVRANLRDGQTDKQLRPLRQNGQRLLRKNKIAPGHDANGALAQSGVWKNNAGSNRQSGGDAGGDFQRMRQVFQRLLRRAVRRSAGRSAHRRAPRRGKGDDGAGVQSGNGQREIQMPRGVAVDVADARDRSGDKITRIHRGGRAHGGDESARSGDGLLAGRQDSGGDGESIPPAVNKTRGEEGGLSQFDSRHMPQRRNVRRRGNGQGNNHFLREKSAGIGAIWIALPELSAVVVNENLAEGPSGEVDAQVSLQVGAASGGDELSAAGLPPLGVRARPSGAVQIKQIQMGVGCVVQVAGGHKVVVAGEAPCGGVADFYADFQVVRRGGESGESAAVADLHILQLEVMGFESGVVVRAAAGGAGQISGVVIIGVAAPHQVGDGSGGAAHQKNRADFITGGGSVRGDRAHPPQRRAGSRQFAVSVKIQDIVRVAHICVGKSHIARAQGDSQMGKLLGLADRAAVSPSAQLQSGGELDISVRADLQFQFGSGRKNHIGGLRGDGLVAGKPRHHRGGRVQRHRLGEYHPHNPLVRAYFRGARHKVKHRPAVFPGGHGEKQRVRAIHLLRRDGVAGVRIFILIAAQNVAASGDFLQGGVGEFCFHFRQRLVEREGGVVVEVAGIFLKTPSGRQINRGEVRQADADVADVVPSLRFAQKDADGVYVARLGWGGAGGSGAVFAGGGVKEGGVGVESMPVVISVHKLGGDCGGQVCVLGGVCGGEFVDGDVFDVVFGVSGGSCSAVAGGGADLQGDSILSVEKEGVVAVGVFAFHIIFGDGDGWQDGGDIGAGAGVKDVLVRALLSVVGGAGGDDDGGDAVGDDNLVAVVILGDDGKPSGCEGEQGEGVDGGVCVFEIWAVVGFGVVDDAGGDIS